ncbi:unnamed protein product [Mytilus coruscus]|uniref:VWFD domain-containing protein n=1 Tax=Mytilus coruscus TaxID=42192 RepID=A0A6J8EIJ4_MYTCO|nr:unnamed protein product [Mytilus coruscus]
MSAYADPCTSHFTMQDQEKRSAVYQFEFGVDTSINDVMLTDGWYRIISSKGDDMPTDPPDMMKCGTWYPIWLNDTLPLVTDGIVSKKVCVRQMETECSNSWNIQIKNCDNYYVYNLVSSDIENSAYCIGSIPVPCPYGYSSETGFYPNCTMDFPDKSIATAEVIVDLVPGPVILPWFGYSLVTEFMCKFDEVFGDDGGEFVYDVHWFINEQSVISHNDIAFTNITITNLTESDWIGKHRLNMVVRCSVRLRYNVGLTPGHEVTSPSYSAGIYPEKYEYQVKENEEIEVRLNSTMPVGCIGHTDKDKKGCAYKLRLAQPYYQQSCDQNNCDICDGNVQQGDLSFKRTKCSYNITSSTWDQPLTLKVTGYVNGQYDNADRTVYLKVLSQPTNYYAVAGLFAMDDIQIPEIKIRVTDDEHQMAGRMYGYRWDYYKPGEYVLYKHKTKPYQVNALFGVCNGIASCNCGIAIRSGNSMFVLRTCDVITQYETRTHPPIAEMRSCDDSSMIIEENGEDYTVTLPIGTEIKFSTSSGWGHNKFIGYIHVKPSILDVESSEGLCGYVSGGSVNTNDDFTLRDGTTVSTIKDNWETFAENWRVHDNERFFVDHPLALNQDINLQQYCICETDETSGTPLDDFRYKCGLEGPLKNCLSQSANAANFHTTCSSSRKRRAVGVHHIITKSLTDSDDIIENREIYIAPDSELSAVETTHIDEWPEGWTEAKAQEVCEYNIIQAVSEDILEVSHTSTDGYIETCKFDIKLAGDTRFLEATISSLQEVAISEISRNRSLFLKENETETTNTKKSLGETLLNSLCRNNCSNNGVYYGVCSCNIGFGKQDCSEPTSFPPRNITIPMSGICDPRERLCAKTNIQGVFYSNNITCRSRHYEILQTGNWRYTSDYQAYEGQYRNSFLVSCELPSARRKRRSNSESIIADGYEISLSNDGTNFGDNVKILIYDQECFSCYLENNTCIELDECSVGTTTEPPTRVSQTSMTSTTKPITVNSSTSSTLAESATTKTSSTLPMSSTESTTETITTSPKTSTVSSESTTKANNVTTSKNENTETSIVTVILAGVIGVLFIIILVLSGMLYSKMSIKKNGHIEDNFVHQFHKPAKDTGTKSQNTDKYYRGNSNSSLGNVSLINLENDNISKPRTPAELFFV